MKTISGRHPVSPEFRAFEKGMYRGQAIAYRTVADWLEEDLAAGRSVAGYIEILRADAKESDEAANRLDAPEQITDADLKDAFGNDWQQPNKDVISRMAKNAIDATPVGSVISFEDAYGKEQ